MNRGEIGEDKLEDQESKEDQVRKVIQYVLDKREEVG